MPIISDANPLNINDESDIPISENTLQYILLA